jgi:hypothetical protein
VTPDEARAIALALPEATEQDHHGKPSFRVNNKIFATLWTDTQMNVKLDEHGIRAVVQDKPDLCKPVYWGKRLAAVGLELERATPQLVEDVLTEAWSLKAPKRLLPSAPT